MQIEVKKQARVTSKRGINCKYLCTQILKAISNKVIGSNKIIVGDFNTSLTSMDRASKQKINVTLNDTLGQMDLKDIFRTFPP